MTPQRFRLAVLASGRGSNFKAIAECCRTSDFPAEVACLITDNRGAGAVDVANAHDIDVEYVEPGTKRGRLADGGEAHIVEVCRNRGVQLIVLAGFMRILRGAVLDDFAGRIINVHPSLLPAFPGLHAQRQAFDYGARVAGCTVHFVDRSVDGGPVILQAAVPVRDGDDVESLSARILEQEHRILVRAVELIARGRLRVDGRRVLGTEEPTELQHRTNDDG